MTFSEFSGTIRVTYDNANNHQNIALQFCSVDLKLKDVKSFKKEISSLKSLVFSSAWLHDFNEC